MNDEQLHDELERRSSSVHVSRDWARRDLLPALSVALDSRPHRVATSRGPALAGLAGVASIILVLVVAIPRVTPTPPVANPSTGTAAPGSSIPGPVLPEVLSAQEFAVGVLTGRLRSSTVLVDGTIGANFRRGPLCPPPGPCDMGRLERTDPSVDVSTRWLHTVESQEAASFGREGTWRWWHLPSGPITGTLVLAVDAEGIIEFIGLVDPATEARPLTVADATEVDIEALNLGDVVLVEGWLWTSGVPGEDVNILCMSPQFTPPPGLPDDSCPRTGRDAVVDYRNNVASSLTAPEPRLQVQRGAAAEFQGTVGDEPHTFALAPRLYGGACEGAPPCWKWDVVARLTATEEPEQQPNGTAIECSEASTEPTSGPRGAAYQATVIDSTGLVIGCRVLDGSAGSTGPAGLAVSNPAFRLTELLFSWSSDSCVVASEVRFYPSESRYQIQPIDFHSEIQLLCAGTGKGRALALELSREVPAHLVSPTRFGPPDSSTPAPPTPDVAPPPEDAVIECTQPTAEFGAVVIDPTGLVDSCVTVEATGEGVAESAVVRNPDGAMTALQIEWPGTPCAAAVGFTIAPGPTGLTIEMGPRPDGKILGTEHNGTVFCIQPGRIHAIRLELNGPVDAANVWITPTVVPTTSLRTLSCAESVFSVKDATGTISSCRGTPAEDPPDGIPLITNPDGDTNRLRVTWMTQDPAACGPEPPAVSLVFTEASDPPRFVVSTASDYAPSTGCFAVARSFALDLELSKAITSSDVVFATSGSLPFATGVTEAGIFDLMIDADKPEYRTGEPIEIDAVLQYDGRQPSVELWGVGSLVNGFGIKQLDGPLVMGPGWDEPCVRHELQRREPLGVPYEKSAAWSDDDPDGVFYRDWVQDPELRLPAGTWLITAYSEFAVGSDCAGPLVSLQASLLIVVR